MTKSFTIRGIDPKLYKEFKAACAHYDLIINDVFNKHIYNIVSDYKRQKQFKPPSIEDSTKGRKTK